MAKYVKDESGNVTTTDDGFLDDVTSGIKMIALKDGELIDAKSVRYGMAAWGTGLVALTSLVTRRRAASGSKPLAKVFF